MTAPQAALRQRRASAARALAGDARRAQLAWDDLAAWPEWATLDDARRSAFARRCGAWLHAGALRRCIDGPTLQQVRALLGEAAFTRLMAGSDSKADDDTPPLPAAETLPAWLQAEGTEAMLAAVASPLLRLLLRERFAPRTLPPMPALDAVRARKALAEAVR